MDNGFDIPDGQLWSWALLLGAALAGLVAHWVGGAVLRRVLRGTPRRVLSAARRPARPILMLLGPLLVLPVLEIGLGAAAIVRHFCVLGLIAALAWLGLALLTFLGAYAEERYRIDRPDNLIQRQMRTRIQVFRRIGAVVVVFVAGAAMLMAIPGLRHLGVSLFASAGIAGIAIGFAARPVLSNLVAGVQIALTQPIRVDDAVVVQGEWGWIEEIGATYVVVRIWDLRRLVVPLTWFVENPFQNWTRQTADLIGTVLIHADYTVPVDELRAELRRIAESEPLWDGKVCVLHVTEATERTIQMRALVSARNSPETWDLRCAVRERLVAWLQRSYPDSLPRLRAELDGGPGEAPTASAAA